MEDTFWFWQWLEEVGARSAEEAAAAMKRRGALAGLRDKANAAIEADLTAAHPQSILAGTGIDLTGQYACQHYECRIAQVDQLFRQAWLYFDQIVVADFISPLLAHPANRSSRRGTANDPLTHALEVLFYIKSLRAEDLISFQVKGHWRYCQLHLNQKLSHAGLDGILDQKEAFIQKIEPHVEVHIERRSTGNLNLSVYHPLLEHMVYWPNVRPMDAKDLRRFASEQLVNDALNALVTDVDIAQDLGVPLASTYPLHRMFMSERVTATTARVAFEIKLPVLQSLAVETILNVRRDEYDSFQRFRDALKTAINDRIRLQPDANVERLAEEIEHDVLEPRLRDIDARLKTAQRALLKKAGVAVGVGAMLTTCGLLAGLVPVALGAATIAAGVIAPSQQYLDKRADVELTDMFFLWRLAHEH